MEQSSWDHRAPSQTLRKDEKLVSTCGLRELGAIILSPIPISRLLPQKERKRGKEGREGGREEGREEG